MSRLRVAALLVGAALMALPATAQETPEEVMGRLLAHATFPETSVEALRDEVAEIGGTAFREAVPVQYLDKAGMSRYLQELVDDEYTPEQASVDERLLRGFDLIEPGVELRALRLRLLEENVIGFYDTRPESRRLFAVSSHEQLDPANQMVLAHELRHALQDQFLDLYALLSDDVSDFDDRRLALMGLLEGDATFVMEEYLRRRVPEERRQAPRSHLGGGPVPDVPGAPAVLRDQLVVPYLRGRDFVVRLWQEGGWAAVRAAWDAPPVSTEQVLHPERYLAGEGPLAVTPPPGPEDGRLLLDGVLGEMLIASLLGCQGGTCAAATGWGGDSFTLHAVEGGTTLSWAVVWDDEEEAAEFWQAFSARFEDRHGVPQSLTDGATCYGAKGRTAFRLRRLGERIEMISSDAPGFGCPAEPLT